MAVQTRLIEYTVDDQVFEGYFAFQQGGQKRPVILIAHAWEGRDEFVCDKARQLAALGYNAFALDTYGKGILGSSPEENGQLMAPLLEDRHLLQRRLQAAYDVVAAQDETDSRRIAIMGYCFGGLCALDLARSGADLCGAASFHALLNSPEGIDNRSAGTRILIQHGDQDPLVPVEEVIRCQQEFTAAGADWQMHIYGAARHSFTNPDANDHERGLVYNASADKRSWRQLLLFLEEIFSD
ncbi:MAG: dienelactone hydrolase family protein [Pseudomonadota bacterium]|nr:dienelactone hydrolase family protein [Pseudomonadota bacterium]